MMMSQAARRTPALLVLGTVMLPGMGASAAPFCMQSQSLPPQCIFFDPGTCQKQATLQGGWCVRNEAEPPSTTAASSPYCVVAVGGMTSACTYDDQTACLHEAARQGGACIQAPPRAPGNVPDPYEFTRQLPAG